jgi:aminocarboxymuconate-semialdehyde decarboxylase
LKIDVHAHYLPEKCLDAEAKGTAGHIHGLRIVQEGSRQVAYTNNARNIAFDPPQMYSIERRLKDMATQWLGMQVLSIPPFLFFMPALQLRVLSCVRRSTTRSPKRFKTILIALWRLPIFRCKTLTWLHESWNARFESSAYAAQKFAATSPGKNLDDKGFASFYTKLQQLDVPVFIHPSNVLGADRLRPYHLQNLIGNPSVSA